MRPGGADAADLMPEDIRLVLFDLDDTLYDHSHARDRCLLALRRHFPLLARRPLPELARRYDDILNRVHDHVLNGSMTAGQARRVRLGKLLSGEGIDPGEEAFEMACRLWVETYERSQRAVPGSRVLLESLLALGVRVGIVTNGLTEVQQAKIEVCGLTDLLDPVLSSEAAGRRKPDPGIFELALQRADVPPGAAVMVGDSWVNDVLGAQGAGIRPVWLNRDRRPVPEPGVPAEGPVPALDSLEPADKALSVILGR